MGFAHSRYHRWGVGGSQKGTDEFIATIKPRAYEKSHTLTITQRPNSRALTDGMDIYRDAIRTFIVQQLGKAETTDRKSAVIRALHPENRQYFERDLARNRGNLEATIDITNFSWIIENNANWDQCFESVFGHKPSTRNQLRTIADSRNAIAHPDTGDLDAYHVLSALTQIAEVLDRIDATTQKTAIEQIRESLVQPPLAPQPAAGTSTLSTVSPTITVPELAEPKPKPKPKPRPTTNTGLKPWREVINPHPDILSGELAQAEFAADLQQVTNGTARAKEYNDPIEFFRRTYITPGIRTLLVNTLKRINGKPGDPVIQTKTGFGGGKTHSLIALYHLVTHTKELAELTKQSDDRTAQELTQVFTEAEVIPDEVQNAQVAVLIGTYLSPTDDDKTVDGDPLNTLWGQMAYQLGGQEAYNIVGDAARQGTSPGGAQLDRLFEHVGPAVILFDEIVAYVRNVPEQQTGSVYTFMQALSESVRRNPNVVLVVALPESEEEAGGDLGYQALSRLERVFGRIEAVHAPLETTEAFEVVRRRLFEDPKDPEALQETCEKFAAMYRRTRREYPDHAAEPAYRERLKQCYPIHPEIFDRLYNDWSSIHRFQRTRGVLRLMALWIKRLYGERTPDPLILPANLPLDDSNLSEEFIKLLPGRWEPVVSEIDGTNSRTDRLDNEKERWLSVGGAAKRITRTIFLGSVPGKAIRGIDQNQIRLGVVQPTESTSVYNEARNDITGKLYYLHQANSQFFFHTEENLNKVHADRFDAIPNRVADRLIIYELNEAAHSTRNVIVCPESSAEIPDTDSVRFVISDPDKHLPTRQSDTDTSTPFAKEITLNRGDAPRIYRNTVVFITARFDEIRALRRTAKTHLAWDSMLNGEDKLDLARVRRAEVGNHIRNSRNQLQNDLTRAYRWVIAPAQRNPQQSDYTFNSAITDASETSEIVRSADAKLVADDKLVDAIGPLQLVRLLKTYIWIDANDHITVDELWTLFTSHVYFPRLRTKSVLEQAIERGTVDGDFGYADGYDGDQYYGLRFRQPVDSLHTNELYDVPRLIVEPEMASLQKALDDAKPQAPPVSGGPPTGCPKQGPEESPHASSPHPSPSKIVATKQLQGDISHDVSNIQAEIVRNLQDDGGQVTVTITVSASKTGGFSEETLRAVRINGTQLELQIEESRDG